MIFKPAYEYIDDGKTHGVMSKFSLGENILKSGTLLLPGLKKISADIKMLKDISVKMRDGISIYVDIFLPYNSDNSKILKYPTLIAWSPYGKVPVLLLDI